MSSDNSINSDEAKETLRSVSASTKTGAKHGTRAPWWYGPSTYLCVGLFVASPAYQHNGVYWSLILLALAILVVKRGDITGTNPRLDFMTSRQKWLAGVGAAIVLGSLYVCGLILMKSFGFGLAPWFTGALAALVTYAFDFAQGRRYEKFYDGTSDDADC